MNKTFLALLLLETVLFCSVTAQTVKITVTLSQTKNWIPLGKFTPTTSTPRVRAKIATEPILKATQKSDIYVVAYSLANWEAALNGTNCTSRLEQMFAQFNVRIPMDASWSDWVNIGALQSGMYLVASDCFSNYALGVSGQLTDFEIENCIYEPIPEHHLHKTPAAPEPAPVRNVTAEKFESMSRYYGIKAFPIMALVFC